MMKYALVVEVMADVTTGLSDSEDVGEGLVEMTVGKMAVCAVKLGT